MIGLETRVTVPKTVTVREIDGEAVVVDLQDGYYFGLNGTATEMWGYLVELGTPAAALEALQRTQAAPRAQLEDDLLGFVEALVRRKLLKVVPT